MSIKPSVIVLLLVSEHLKAARKIFSEINPSSQFHQRAYAQLLCVQMLWCSIYILQIILTPTLPVHSIRSYAQLYPVHSTPWTSEISINILAQKLLVEYWWYWHDTCSKFYQVFDTFEPEHINWRKKVPFTFTNRKLYTTKSYSQLLSCMLYCTPWAKN